MVRQTREVTMLVSKQMTFFDALQDAFNKFTRINIYIADDHVHFGRTLSDLEAAIKEQTKQLLYLEGVAKESAEGAAQARQAYNETDEELRKAEIEERRMLKELRCALDEHHDICSTRLKELVNMNVEVKRINTTATVWY